MAVKDSFPEVWKQALDGLVTLGGPEARSALVRFMDDNPNDKRVTWVREALQQLAIS